MKILYLHIGTPKTGTSAIQYFCIRNRDTLEKDGLYYPDFGYHFNNISTDRNGAFYIANIYDAKNNHIEIEEDRIRAEGLEKLKNYFETHDRILLSDEGFWNHPKMTGTKDWSELLDFCHKINVHLKIIVYLRRQDEVIQSFWAQKVKERNLKKSLSKYISSGQYTKFHLDYYEHLQEIASVVGKENIIVKIYEKGQYQGKSNTLISDFFSIFSIGISNGYVEENTQRNLSLHGIYLESKRLLNISREFENRGRFLVKRLRDLQTLDKDHTNLSKIKQFSYEEALEFLKKYETGNQNIAKEYLHREDGVLFYNELNPVNYSRFGETPKNTQKVINIYAKIIAEQERELQEMKEQLKNLQQRSWKQYLRRLKNKIHFRAKFLN